LVDKINLKPGGIELSINLPLPVDGTHGAAPTVALAHYDLHKSPLCLDCQRRISNNGSQPHPSPVTD
jgi:hypothetical protein